MLLGVDTFGGPWNIVSHAGPDPPQRGGRKLGKILPVMDPVHISGMVEARDLKFACVQRAADPNKNYAK